MATIFGEKTIKSRVMDILNAKIKEAQNLYDSGCKSIDEEAKTKKTQLADQMVENIVGKFL